MRRTINNSVLNKSFILSKISQESIFSYYTGLDISEIQECIDKGTLISSPFRVDNHPSFGFRYNNKGQLKAKDFAGYFHGDCFDAAALVLSEVTHKDIDINNKNCFVFVLKHIAYSFRNIIYGKDVDYLCAQQVQNGLIQVKNKKPIIEIVPRQWNNKDIHFWNQYGIDLSYLNTNFIYPVEQYYINRKINPEPKYYYVNNPNDVCYAYILGQDSNGIYNIKLYFPNRPKGNVRFITNSNCLEGLLGLELDNYDAIIITKSTKDRLALRCYLDEYIKSAFPYGGTALRIGLVNLPHETYRLNQNEYDFLISKCNNCIISLMDNDSTGYREAIWLRNTYNIIPICIPKDLNVKDFAELRKEYSLESIDKLTEECINYINIEQNGKDNEITWDSAESNIMPF